MSSTSWASTHSPSSMVRTRSSRHPALPTSTTRASRWRAARASRQPSGPWPKITTVIPGSTRPRSIPSRAQASGSAKAALDAARPAAIGTVLQATSRGGSAMCSP